MSSGDEVPRLLRGLTSDGRPLSLTEHLALHGPVPAARARRDPDRNLVAEIERSGLRGRGGAAFPVALKLAAVGARRGRRVVVVNGCEGEPVSSKDRVLLNQSPHLVLDGATVAARAVGAAQIVVATKLDSAAVVEHAVAERVRARLDEPTPRVVVVPDRYVAGQESALVNFLNSGRSAPTLVPPRPFERGVGGQPTLIQNAETVANLALIAGNGAEWFRRLGPAADPGTVLVTLTGAVERAGLYEVARGTSISVLLQRAGGPSAPVQAFLVGGYAGSWLTAAAGREACLDEASMAARGAVVAVGAVTVLPDTACGVAETARILRYLAEESAGQCGPCVHGLASIAGSADELARGIAERDVVTRLERWAGQIAGRGACHHPDGAVRMLASALRCFSDDVAAHRSGRPCPAAPPAGSRHRRGVLR